LQSPGWLPSEVLLLALLALAAWFPAEEEPSCFTEALPPSAVLDAGADTRVLPPVLLPRTAALLPLPTTIGTLTAVPDFGLPAFAVPWFVCVEFAFWFVVFDDDVDEPSVLEPLLELELLALLPVAAALCADDVPSCFTEALPPLAVLDAGAETSVLPPVLLPRTAALLPLPTTIGTLTAVPDWGLPAFAVPWFVCVELAFWFVVFDDEVDEPPLLDPLSEPLREPFSEPLPELLEEPEALLAVEATLPADDQPSCSTQALPPLAVLDAGAHTTVSPPLLLPRSPRLLPFARTIGTLKAEPDVGLPAFAVPWFVCVEFAFWFVVLLLTTFALAAVAVNTVRPPTMTTPSIPRPMLLIRMSVFLLYWIELI
jgi:hypothetical protein